MTRWTFLSAVGLSIVGVVVVVWLADRPTVFPTADPKEDPMADMPGMDMRGEERPPRKERPRRPCHCG